MHFWHLEANGMAHTVMYQGICYWRLEYPAAPAGRGAPVRPDPRPVGFVAQQTGGC